MNKAILSGRIGKSAEVKQQSDRFIYEFSLATDEPKKNQDGSWGRETTWHNIVLWSSTNKLAEMLKQGTQITVEGSIRYRQWEKDGVKHYRTEIVTDSRGIDLHLPPRQQNATQPQPVQQQQPQYQQPQQQYNGTTSEDGLPF